MPTSRSAVVSHIHDTPKIPSIKELQDQSMAIQTALKAQVDLRLSNLRSEISEIEDLIKVDLLPKPVREGLTIAKNNFVQALDAMEKAIDPKTRVMPMAITNPSGVSKTDMIDDPT